MPGEQDPHSLESPLTKVGRCNSSPTLLCRGGLGRLGSVGPLLQELRARSSPAPPQLSKLLWGHVSREPPGGAEVREIPLSR
jgi:hypothetical protein